ncbi:MAG: Transposase [Cenarchaeum symbiont of Oopsacas minuta]|nr:Transposase [Cenarchaeum symbiont of Oopsacas minuta]
MCYNWQNNLKRDLSGTKFEDFTVIEEDESIFVYDSITGKKYWTVDIPPVVKWTGMHSKIIVYGAVTEDGRQLFKTYHRFDSESTVDYLKLLEKKFGKIFVILDRAPQHRSRMVKEYLRDHKDTVKLRYLPRATPRMNAVEECWRQGKYAVAVSETSKIMKYNISEYYRTVRFKNDYLYSKPRIPKDF